MTENKRFHFGYVCGDTGLIDEQAEIKWFIENCCSITDLKKNWKTVCDKLNELNEEKEELKRKHYNELMEEGVKIEKLREENEELKERVKQLQIDNTVIKKRYDTLLYENEELQIKKVVDNLYKKIGEM